MENKASCSISGSGKVSGGEYNQVSISGSGKAEGDIRANTLRVSGSGRFAAVQVREAQISGIGTFNGPVTAEEMRVSGTAHFNDHLEAQSLQVSGAVHARQNLHASSARVSGVLRVDGGAEFEQAMISGAVKVDGLLNAGQLCIQLNAASNVFEIGGASIRIERGKHSPVGLVDKMFQLFNSGKKFCRMNAGSIEGSEVYLESTECRVVRGENVTIGPDCRIELVEYAKSLTVDESSQVVYQKQI